MGSASPLWNRSVLVIEDEPLIALEIHRAVSAAGASVVAATTIREAIALIRGSEVSVAIVDINLGGQDCSEVCRELTRRKIPFLFYTGYTAPHFPNEWAAVPFISKPASPDGLVATVVSLIH
jgi:DNA-binding response OmpR family regulator